MIKTLRIAQNFILAKLQCEPSPEDELRRQPIICCQLRWITCAKNTQFHICFHARISVSCCFQALYCSIRMIQRIIMTPNVPKRITPPYKMMVTIAIDHQSRNKKNNYGCDYHSSCFVPVRSCSCCHIHNFDFWYKEKLKKAFNKMQIVIKDASCKNDAYSQKYILC